MNGWVDGWMGGWVDGRGLELPVQVDRFAMCASNKPSNGLPSKQFNRQSNRHSLFHQVLLRCC